MTASPVFGVHALTWLWGSWGEEDTETELARLGDGWYVRHDIANEYGNWDHVAVGPPGVFMVESKRLSGRRIEIERDGLSSGRLHFGGKTFRGASAGLRHALLAQARGALTCHSQSKEELKCHPGVPSVLPTHPVRPLA